MKKDKEFIKREPKKNNLKNWPVKYGGKFKNVYDLLTLIRNNGFEGIIKVVPLEFNLLKENRTIVHFNFERSGHVSNKEYLLTEILRSGYFKSDDDFKLPTLNLDGPYIGRVLEVRERVKIEDIDRKLFSKSMFKDGNDLIKWVVKNYENQISNISKELVLERGVSITIIKVLKRFNFDRIPYYEFLNLDSLGSTRKGFGKGIVLARKKNKRVVALTADLKPSVQLVDFEKKFPNDFYEFSITEQNMMSAAAGMCLNNKIPVVTSFAVFNPGRNWDQLRVSVCYSNHNVKVLGSHAGLSTGPDGATHQALEDIAITRTLPNLTVIVPADEEESKKVIMEAIKLDGPVYIRVSREKSLNITNEDSKFEIGKANILDYGRDVTIIASGLTLQFALEASKILRYKFGVRSEVINLHTIKPLDVNTILRSVKRTGAIVSIEEHQRMGGMGSAIAEVIVEKYLVPMEIIGVEDVFGESGDGYELLNKYGISTQEIIKRVKKVIRRKNKNN